LPGGLFILAGLSGGVDLPLPGTKTRWISYVDVEGQKEKLCFATVVARKWNLITGSAAVVAGSFLERHWRIRDAAGYTNMCGCWEFSGWRWQR
jgi:hypothetical protein